MTKLVSVGRASDIQKMTEESTSPSKPLYEIEVQQYLAQNLHMLGTPRLELIQTEYPVVFGKEQGRIDILAKDSSGDITVIEVKRGVAGRGSVGQLQSYMGAMLNEFPRRRIRGIIVASDLDDAAKSALLVAQVTFFRFQIHFKFQAVEVKNPLGDEHGLRPDGDEAAQRWSAQGMQLTNNFKHCRKCGAWSRVVIHGKSSRCEACGEVR